MKNYNLFDQHRKALEHFVEEEDASYTEAVKKAIDFFDANPISGLLAEADAINNKDSSNNQPSNKYSNSEDRRQPSAKDENGDNSSVNKQSTTNRKDTKKTVTNANPANLPTYTYVNPNDLKILKQKVGELAALKVREIMKDGLTIDIKLKEDLQRIKGLSATLDKLGASQYKTSSLCRLYEETYNIPPSLNEKSVKSKYLKLYKEMMDLKNKICLNSPSLKPNSKQNAFQKATNTNHNK